jgi:glycosyltransferase involved in cell wall biosynthesis
MCYRINLINTHDQICSGPQFGVHCAEKCLYAPWSNEGFMGRYQQADGLLGAAGARICPSEYVADRYRDAFPALEFSVIPHGINMLLLSNNTAPPPSAAGLTFGFIGTIVPQKGLTTLLRAFAAVPDPKLKLVVVGGFYCDPVYQREVQNLIDADPRIVLRGEVSTKQVYQILQTLDVLCLPSHVPETFSLVFNEAAAAGVPALVSDFGAPRERIAQFGGGRILPVGDIPAWAQAIKELANNPETIKSWCAELPLPLCIEEEAFFYESFYRRLQQPS